MPDNPASPVGSVEDPELPELAPVFPLLDPVFPPGPVFSVPGFAFSGFVVSAPMPVFLPPLFPIVPLSALPGSPASPPGLPPGAGVLWATSMESGITSPGAVLAADA